MQTNKPTEAAVDQQLLCVLRGKITVFNQWSLVALTIAKFLVLLCCIFCLCIPCFFPPRKTTEGNPE